MNRLIALCLVLGQLSFPTGHALGQDAPGLPVSPAGPVVGAIVPPPNKKVGPEVLGKNYSLKLTLAQGETVTDFTLLTASPAISFNGTGQGEIPVIVTLSGTLAEVEGGKLVLVYSVGGRIPTITGSAVEGQVNGRPVQRNVQYADETSTGAIHVTPGKSQTLIKSAGRRYSVTITPAEEPAE